MKADDLSSVTQSLRDCSSSRGEYDGLEETVAEAIPVHGRDSEKQELLQVYQRVVETQESQIVFVHGTSGQGKTRLVDTLREPVCESNGYFCSGKFFQDPDIQEPYAAITAAFSDLCDLVAQSPELNGLSPEFDEESQNRIQEFLEFQGHLLSRSVNLSPFLFTGNSIGEDFNRSVEKTVTFAAFRAACKAFLVAMASRKHPVVLFIDDVHWMDSGSLKLLDLMKDDDINNVLLVFSYRDEDASAVQGLLQSYTGAGFTDIQLSNLDLSGVSEILVYQLGSTANNIDELSKLTLQRTGGNPFFVSLFLETLGREEFITMNGTTLNFDVEKIRNVMMAAESIADCLSEKVSQLPSKVKDVLTVASLVGYTFNEEILLEVPDTIKFATTTYEKREELASLLEFSLDEGFIERIKGGYQFVHDKVQNSFQNLMDEPSRDRLHLVIGMMFLLQNTEGSMYNAVVHLNVAPGFLHSREQNIRLARLNLDASRFCTKTSAFHMAESLLRKGLELLDSVNMKWSQETFDLSLDLTESLARMSLLVGAFDACFAATSDAMLYVETKERKVNLLLINVECRMANNDMAGSIQASIETLSELGVEFPRKLTMRHAMVKIIKVMFLMSRKTHLDLLSLPHVANESNIAVVFRLIMHVTFFTSLINDEATGIYANAVGMTLTLQHGLSTYTPAILSIFAVGVLQTGNVERAYNWGKLALTLMERNPSREADRATIGFVNPLLLHWMDPICDLRDPLFAAATAGFDSGDVVYSAYCISAGMNMEMFDGTHLAAVERCLSSYYNQIHDLGQDELKAWVRPLMQYVANLRSSSPNWWQLAHMSGDFMENLTNANAIDNQVLVKGGISYLKARLANVFGFHHIAREMYKELEPLEHVYESVFVFNMMCWDACVAYYEGFIAEGKRKHLRKARKYKKHLKKRDAFGPNASTYLKHLALKETFMRRRRRPWTDLKLHNDETLRLLNQELERVSLSGSFGKQPCYVIARAFSDAGTIAERMGRVGEARQYYECAREIYTDNWGAISPAAWLEEKCEILPRVLPQETTFNTSHSLVGSTISIN